MPKFAVLPFELLRLLAASVGTPAAAAIDLGLLNPVMQRLRRVRLSLNYVVSLRRTASVVVALLMLNLPHVPSLSIAESITISSNERLIISRAPLKSRERRSRRG